MIELRNDVLQVEHLTFISSIMLIRRTAPTLPVEIWHRILRFATWVPFALNTDLPDYFAYPPTPTQDQIQEELLHALSTKNNLTRVCRYWNVLATPFLYEAVPVCSRQGFTALRRTIEASAASCNGGHLHQTTEHVPLGHWVKRIDIMLSEAVHNQLEWSFDLMYNLEIFVSRRKGSLIVGHVNGSQHSPIALPASSKIRNLKNLDICQTLTREQADMLHDVIGNNPSLTQLHCRTLRPVEDYCFKENFAELPIRLWDVDSQMIDFDVVKHLPIYKSMHCLRYLICHSYNAGSRICTALPIFGPTLETLELDFPDDAKQDDLLSDAAHMCPTLRTVIINVLKFEILDPKRLTDFPFVANIGLRFSRHRHCCKRKQFNSLCRRLADVVRRTGTIKVIRVLDQRTADYLLRDHLPPLKCLSATLSLDQRCVRLEGPNGHSILRAVEHGNG